MLVAHANCGGEQKLGYDGKVVLIVENQPHYAQSLVKQLLFARLEPVVAMTGEGGLKKAGAPFRLGLAQSGALGHGRHGVRRAGPPKTRKRTGSGGGDEPVRAFKGEVPRRRL